jgi:hypothetical protein
MNTEERATLLRDLMTNRSALPVAEELINGSVANHEGAPFDPSKTRSWKLGWLEADSRHDDIAPLLVALSHLSTTTALSIMDWVVLISIDPTEHDTEITGAWVEKMAAVQAPLGGTKTHLVMAACAIAKLASWELQASEQRLKDLSSDPHFSGE